MKFLRVFCVIALVAFFAVSAYAETQNVKVSGDLTIRSLFRNNYDFPNGQDDEATNAADVGMGAAAVPSNRKGIDRNNQNWFMSTTELQVDADLTDNVSTCIRLVNQRDWNVAKASAYQGDTAMGVQNRQMSTIGSGGFGHSNAYYDSANEFAVDLELAYVTLKNFIYSPLTLTIGRQNLWFGKGFIVGANQRVRNSFNLGVAMTAQPLSAPEYTSLNAFDSVKAVLDFDPWTLTAIYSKIWGNSVQADDGVDLWGTNVGYKFDSYKGEAEGYWFYKRDKQVKAYADINDGGNDVNTIGIRGSFDPIDIFTVYAELAGQFGSYMGGYMQFSDRSRLAGALDVGAECRYFTDKWAWKPKVGVEYIWYSGHGDEGGMWGAAGSGQYNGWDPMFRGKTDSLIREFTGRYYFSQQYPFDPQRYYNSADNSFQNQHQVILRGTLQPMDSVKLNGNLNMFWNQYAFNDQDTRTQGYIGTEVDLGATWDYTEDVSFGLVAGFFKPGEVYKTSGDTATDVVGTVKVSF